MLFRSSLIPSPAMATRSPFRCSAFTTATFCAGSTSASTWSMPTARATASAVVRLSPVSITTRMPSACSARIASTVLALIGSAELFSYVYLRHVLHMAWWPAYLGTPPEQQRVGTWQVPHPVFGNWHAANARSHYQSA